MDFRWLHASFNQLSYKGWITIRCITSNITWKIIILSTKKRLPTDLAHVVAGARQVLDPPLNLARKITDLNILDRASTKCIITHILHMRGISKMHQSYTKKYVHFKTQQYSHEKYCRGVHKFCKTVICHKVHGCKFTPSTSMIYNWWELQLFIVTHHVQGHYVRSNQAFYLYINRSHITQIYNSINSSHNQNLNRIHANMQQLNSHKSCITAYRVILWQWSYVTQKKSQHAIIASSSNFDTTCFHLFLLINFIMNPHIGPFFIQISTSGQG